MATLRIGDRDRDRAAECLREHLASGRLDPEEFDQRLEAALTARVHADLDVLFDDLPAPRPVVATPMTPPASSPAPAITPQPSAMSCAGNPFTAQNALIGIVWSAAVAVCFLTGWQLWWLMAIPFVVSATVHRQRSLAVAGRRATLHAGHRR